MNRTGALALAALALCIIPPLATAQTPCDSLEMTLVVRVEAAGATEAAALHALAGEVESVRDAVGTPCVVTEPPSVMPYTDGLWDATLYMDIYGSEAELRGVAASLGGAAEPVRLEVGDFRMVAMPVATSGGVVAAFVVGMWYVGAFELVRAVAGGRGSVRSACASMRKDVDFMSVIVAGIICLVTFLLVSLFATLLVLVMRTEL